MPSLEVIRVEDGDDDDEVVVPEGNEGNPVTSCRVADATVGMPPPSVTKTPSSSAAAANSGANAKKTKSGSGTTARAKKESRTVAPAPPLCAGRGTAAQPQQQQTKLSQFFFGAAPKQPRSKPMQLNKATASISPSSIAAAATTAPAAATTTTLTPRPRPGACSSSPRTATTSGARGLTSVPPPAAATACVSLSDSRRRKSQLRAIVLGQPHPKPATMIKLEAKEDEPHGELVPEVADDQREATTPAPVQTLLDLFDRQQTTHRSAPRSSKSSPTSSAKKKENRGPNRLPLPQTSSEKSPLSPNDGHEAPCSPLTASASSRVDGEAATDDLRREPSDVEGAPAAEPGGDVPTTEAIENLHEGDAAPADESDDHDDEGAIVDTPMPTVGPTPERAIPSKVPTAATISATGVSTQLTRAVDGTTSPAAKLPAVDSEEPPSPASMTSPSSTHPVPPSTSCSSPAKAKRGRRRRIAPTAVAAVGAEGPPAAPAGATGAAEVPPPADSTPAHSSSFSAAPSPPKEPGSVPGAEEDEAVRQRYRSLLSRYEPRRRDLERQIRELPRLVIPVPKLPENGNGASTEAVDDSVPDAALPAVVALVEGRTEPLPELAREVLDHLRPHHPHLTLDAVQLKIQVLATRCKPPVVSTTLAGDEGEGAPPPLPGMWEVATLELLPPEVVPHVKKARAQRKRLSSYLRAIVQLLDAAAKDGAAAANKVSRIEERVLKFERDDEKLRLIERAREAQKQAQEELKAQKQEERERRKSLEREKKQQAALVKEEAKKQKHQSEEHKRKAQGDDASLSRQKASFMSFFSKPGPSTKAAPHVPGKQTEESKTDPGLSAHGFTAPKVSTPTIPAGAAVTAQFGASQTKGDTAGFDVEAFRSRIITQAVPDRPFALPSESAQRSRRRRSCLVPVSVTVTVFPTEEEGAPTAFGGALPFAERRKVWINNRLRFLKFHEDVRPPYHGSWSKRSRAVSGRRPLGRDACLDYDNDSEAEWEEEEETGEDLDADDADEEEEEPGEQYETDEWLDNDELRSDASNELVVRLVAPVKGVPLCGIPSPVDSSLYVEGFGFDEGRNLLSTHTAIILNESPVCLRVLPPDGRDADGEGDRKKDELSDEDLRTVCRLVHHSRCGSRDKVVDELRSRHPSTTHSRSHAMRVLESIAEKKKDSNGMYYWEVKKDTLEKLKMQDLLDQELVCNDVVDKEKAKNVASFVHHSTLTSKDKLVEEVRTQCSLSSKAEAQRLVDSVAEKKKMNGNVYWSVKEDAQLELGLESLPSTPPPVPRATDPSFIGIAVKTSPIASVGKRKTPEKLLSSESKAKKRLSVDAGSAKMLSMFLKRRES